ncbi:hypothetical protein C8Q76DRAFT_600848, partial [Earliella scabrosa]
LDMAAAVSLRNTCHQMRLHVAGAIRASLRVLLSGFVGESTEFLDALYSHRAVIGGEAALVFLLEDRPNIPPRLQLFVPRAWYPPYLERLHDLLFPETLRITTMAGLSVSERAADECTIFTLHNTRAVVVWCSSTISALSPIVSGPCTALMNFVTTESFGCAYPALTFSRRCLLGDES